MYACKSLEIARLLQWSEKRKQQSTLYLLQNAAAWKLPNTALLVHEN